MDKVALQSLASDLKRICLSIQRDSHTSTERFNKEAEKWLEEAFQKTDDKNIRILLSKVREVLKEKNSLVKAEDCLMYSTLLQNRSV